MIKESKNIPTIELPTYCEENLSYNLNAFDKYFILRLLNYKVFDQDALNENDTSTKLDSYLSIQLRYSSLFCKIESRYILITKIAQNLYLLAGTIFQMEFLMFTS